MYAKKQTRKKRNATIPKQQPYTKIQCQSSKHMEKNIGDFNTVNGWDKYIKMRTHPISADRIRALADDIEDDPISFVRRDPDRGKAKSNMLKYTALLRDLVGFLKNSTLQKYLAESSNKITLDSLRPRREPIKP